MRFSGTRLRQLRRGSGLSATVLAYRLRCGAGTVYEWEQGRAKPTSDHLGGLAAIFGVPIDTFFEPVPPLAEAGG